MRLSFLPALLLSLSALACSSSSIQKTPSSPTNFPDGIETVHAGEHAFLDMDPPTLWTGEDDVTVSGAGGKHNRITVITILGATYEVRIPKDAVVVKERYLATNLHKWPNGCDFKPYRTWEECTLGKDCAGGWAKWYNRRVTVKGEHKTFKADFSNWSKCADRKCRMEIHWELP